MKKVNSDIKIKKVENYASNVSVIDRGDIQRKILNILLISSGILLLCYVFILGNMFWDIVERKALQKEALALSSEVGNLELEYLALSNNIDITLSHSMGFREVKTSFATRHPVVSLAQASNEI